MPEFCLVLCCPASVEERLVDVLLDAVGDSSFTRVPAFSHGTAQRGLSPADQVMGRSASVQMQIVLTGPGLNDLLQRLRDEFRGAGLRYWTIALASQGGIE